MRADVEQRVSELAPSITVLQKMTSGEDVTGARVDDPTSGRVEVEQEIDTAKRVVGFEATHVGMPPERAH